jgi:hypothetical protein
MSFSIRVGGRRVRGSETGWCEDHRHDAAWGGRDRGVDEGVRAAGKAVDTDCAGGGES